MRKTIIYIGGYGRSGSTALELYLSQKYNYFSCGELISVNKKNFREIICNCGKTLNCCDFWSKCKFNNSSNIIDFAFKKSKNSVLVDSSKTTYLSFFRPFLLSLNFNVIYVYNTRNPSDVFKSISKGSNRVLHKSSRLLESQQYLFFSRGLSFLLSVFLSKLTFTVFKNKIRVHYDNFILEQNSLCNDIESIIGKQSFNNSNFTTRHTIGGNRFSSILGQNKFIIKKEPICDIKLPFWCKIVSFLIQRLY